MSMKMFRITFLVIVLSFSLFISNVISEEIKIKKFVIDTPLLEEKYPISFGSGLFFLRRDYEDFIFLSITDRGPNADSPEILIQGKFYPSKIFPIPEYSPKIGFLRITDNIAYIEKFEDIINEDYSKTTGKPLPLNMLGTTGEIPLNLDLNIINFDERGIDPEGIVMDSDDYIWICEEYGPSIIKIDPKNYRILERFSPGNGLPDILKWRQPNRGFEGIAFYNNKIYAAFQSTLDVEGKTKNLVNFVRIVEIDLKTKEVKTYAYPLDDDYAKYSDGMIGDMVSIGDGKFLIIERGKLPKGYKNIIYMININSASPLPNDFREIDLLGNKLDDKYLLKKRKILNLREIGYNFEKSEGLAVLDEKTIAVINDNDFGIKSNISKFKSPQLTDKRIIEKDSNRDVTGEFKIEANNESLELWLIELPFSIYNLDF